MKFDKVEDERQGLRAIRQRWQLRGWKFTPLERLDGVNETIESLDALRNSPVCWSSTTTKSPHPRVELLLDDLEELYALALAPWTEYKTVFECKATQRECLRWPGGMFPARIQRDARYRFWELVTTSRFSVNALPSIFDLQRVNWTTATVTVRHAVSLAAMVCIKDAIEALEWIECWWDDDSKAYRAGKPFRWLAQHDPGRMELILAVMFETADECEPHNEKIKDAWDARNQAEAWLAHLNTLDFKKAELEQSDKVAAAEKSKKARAAAKNPRKGTSLTPEVLAAYFNERPGQKWETVRDDLAKKYAVSERTVARRYASAKQKNLMS